VLCSVADKLTNIASLDLSENEFGDEGVAIITEGLCYNSALKHLSLDKNFKSKTKARY
jgi:Ran GTPase-activating protein (RanGAP) involved in mRNA processing and transport